MLILSFIETSRTMPIHDMFGDRFGNYHGIVIIDAKFIDLA